MTFENDIKRARAAGNEYDYDARGRFPWDRSERRGKATRLSKKSLGEFVYTVLSVGGDITNFHCMYPQYHRSSVFARVWLTMDAREKLEAETPYRFDPPPVPNLD